MLGSFREWDWRMDGWMAKKEEEQKEGLTLRSKNICIHQPLGIK